MQAAGGSRAWLENAAARARDLFSTPPLEAWARPGPPILRVNRAAAARGPAHAHGPLRPVAASCRGLAAGGRDAQELCERYPEWAFCMHVRSPLRRNLIWLVHTRLFGLLSFTAVLLNCVLLALETNAPSFAVSADGRLARSAGRARAEPLHGVAVSAGRPVSPHVRRGEKLQEVELNRRRRPRHHRVRRKALTAAFCGEALLKILAMVRPPHRKRGSAAARLRGRLGARVPQRGIAAAPSVAVRDAACAPRRASCGRAREHTCARRRTCWIWWSPC